MLEAHDLEGQQRQRIFVDRHAQQRLAVLGIDALERFTIGGRGQEVDDGVEQRLHALVLEGRAAHHRIEGSLDGRLADQTAQRVLVGLLALEVGFHGLVFHVDGGFDHGGAIFGGALLHVLRNLLNGHLGVLTVAVPDVGLHGDEVDHAGEVALGTDRQLDRNRAGAQLLFDVVDAHVEVGAGLIHLVGKDDTRHAILVALTPDGLGLRLDALVAVEHAHGAVEHAQRTLDLDGEVDVTWGVDDVQAAHASVTPRPEAGGRGRRDGDAALGFLLHEIHGRGAVVHFTDLVGLASVIKDPLSRRRLPSINVSHDAEVAVILDVVLAGHSLSAPEFRSPAIMGEGAVRLCHLMGVFPLLHCRAPVVGGIQKLA